MSTAYLRFIFCVIHISMKEIAEKNLARNWSASIFATTANFFLPIAVCQLSAKQKCCVGMKHRRRRKKIEEKAMVVAAGWGGGENLLNSLPR